MHIYLVYFLLATLQPYNLPSFSLNVAQSPDMQTCKAAALHIGKESQAHFGTHLKQGGAACVHAGSMTQAIEIAGKMFNKPKVIA